VRSMQARSSNRCRENPFLSRHFLPTEERRPGAKAGKWKWANPLTRKDLEDPAPGSVPRTGPLHRSCELQGSGLSAPKRAEKEKYRRSQVGKA
jgi:hypothetical protein